MSYLFPFSYCSWGSQGKNTGVVCHPLLQWTALSDLSTMTHPPWWPAQLIASLRNQKLPTSLEHRKSKEIPRNICFIDYAKALDCADHNKLWKILKEMRIRPPYLPPEKPVCRSRSKLEPDMEQLASSKLGKEYIKVVYCHPAYLTSMQSTSCKMLG